MIGTIQVKINSAHPNIALQPIFAFRDSPSSLRIIDVPKKIGQWQISNVIVRVNYPDNTLKTIQATLIGGAWVASFDGCSVAGKSLNGYAIVAYGTDERGQITNNYILGKGDVVILDDDGRIVVDGQIIYIHLLSEEPDDPKDGDTVNIDGVWKIFQDGEWKQLGNSGKWGEIAGDITEQEDLIDLLDQKADNETVETIAGKVETLETKSEQTNQNLSQLSGKVETNISDIEAIEAEVAEISADVESNTSDITNVKDKIPNDATSQNQLADKAFVNSSINNYAAFYITKNANGDAFQTYNELTSATQFFNAGQAILPTKNDYCVVLQDETKTTALSVDPTTRYTWQGEKYPDGQWEFQYIVNNTALTQTQVNAINSGITKEIVDNRVIPSTSNAGYAQNAVNALTATKATTAIINGETKTFSEVVNLYAPVKQSDISNLSSTIENEYAKKTSLKNWALSADVERDFAKKQEVEDNYTSLELFNSTLGNLSAIIRGI